MGASQSIDTTGTGEGHPLKDDMARLNEIITSVVNENNIFNNAEYNFLSQDVCKKYQVVLESDLKNQLKIDIKSIGETLLLIPREEEKVLLTKRGLKKDEICTRIANHYMRILYILCLIKYVYNVERFGDLSIAGILFRNISVTKNTLQINFCKTEQKDLRHSSGEAAKQLNFGNLEGLFFFTEYFLEPEEATTFIRTLRHVLARKSAGVLRNDFCDMGAKKLQELEDLFTEKTKDKLVCAPTAQSGGARLNMSIAHDSPIFEQSWCQSPGTITVPLAEEDGQRALKLYKRMRSRFNKNIKDIEAILETMVERNGTKWTLKDITKEDLDTIIENVKTKVKVFYLQSLVDFQNVLDQVKSFPKSIVV